MPLNHLAYRRRRNGILIIKQAGSACGRVSIYVSYVTLRGRLRLNDDRIRAALAELQRERQQVMRLRAEHRTLVGSRFYALRAFWLSLHGLFGFGRRRQAYIAWNTGGHASPAKTAVEKIVDEAEVAAAWRTRIRERSAPEPVATVIIPVYNHLNDTLRCLNSIAQTWFESLSVEFIVIDDASEDRSQAVLDGFPGIRYMRNPQNAGFLRSCNLAAKEARGKYICFLNNDTIVKNAWLDHLVSTAEGDSTIGAVGAKLLYPDGTLQEAGAIIWRNGDGWNYGRGADPSNARYNFEREVDYCSGAALLVRRSAFEALGGFDDQFAPAYYEDADLCLALRQAGYRVAYQPKAEVVHLEGVTSGTDIATGVKRHQEHNRPKFEQKWRSVLQTHLEGNPAQVEAAARRFMNSPRVLFIDSYVPMHDKEAGSNRLMHIIAFLRKQGCGVAFLPDNYADLQPYTGDLQSMGVEVLYHTEGGPSMDTALRETLHQVECVWICRPELFAKYGPVARAASRAQIVYDTIDLHFVRKQREAQILGRDVDWRSYEQLEVSAAKSADATVVVSGPERDVLAERGISDIHVIPTVHDRAITGGRTFEGTHGLLFIGNYNHTPNVDAATWLCREVMPHVRKAIPDVKLTLLGSNPTDAVRSLASRRVLVPGYVPDVTSYFMSARLFLAPLRFGAGLKGKLGQAMSYGLPIIATDVAVEGFGMVDGEHCIIANDGVGFANAIVRAYSDKDSWQHASGALLEKSAEFSSAAVGSRVLTLLRGLVSLA